jgi:hypothetical protein
MKKLASMGFACTRTPTIASATLDGKIKCAKRTSTIVPTTMTVVHLAHVLMEMLRSLASVMLVGWAADALRTSTTALWFHCQEEIQTAHPTCKRALESVMRTATVQLG